MNILKSWLNDYLKTDISDKDLIEKIIFSGTEVEGVFGELDEKIIVVQIKSIEKHPNADRLSKVIVNDGANDIQIVCGANNIEAGQIVPLAKVGTRIGDLVISEATIRGLASSGMLCSEKELGVGDDHSGIKILPENTPLGSKVSEILKSDIILDIKPTPNRGDCFCHLGMAREVAATLGKKVDVDGISIEKVATVLVPAVEIMDKSLCMRYGARIVRGVKIGPSKPQIANRLTVCGMKPINNVVDITNYIMLDLGQPMHAFDAAKIKDNKIIVRLANENEKILCLDGKERNLSKDNLVIADFEKPIAIAGIIGGKDSEISDDTVDIIFEAAEFERKNIRKSSKYLEIVTDASYRFERGIDSAGIERALDKACLMILDDCPTAEIGETFVAGEDPATQEVEINHEGINKILGTDINDAEIDKILTDLGFEVLGSKCKVPSFRHDIVDFRCLSEEVGRIYGYGNIPDHEIEKPEKLPEKGGYYKKEYLKDQLVGIGFSETYNYSFMSENDLKEADIRSNDLLVITNPVQLENKYMRNSLVPGLLKSVAKNPTFDPILIFEMGNVFTKKSEKTMLGVVASGKDAKKSIDAAVAALTKSNSISTTDIEINEIERSKVERFKIKKPVSYVFECETSVLIANLNVVGSDLALKLDHREIHYRPISKYPSVTRDLAFVTKKSTHTSDIMDEIYGVSELINRVELFDEFESDKIGANKKSAAFHIYLQAPDRTLTDQETDVVINNVISKIETKFESVLRS